MKVSDSDSETEPTGYGLLDYRLEPAGQFKIDSFLLLNFNVLKVNLLKCFKSTVNDKLKEGKNEVKSM